ncbi:uncharacterized protein K441DRAFT_695107 [Cenococcum geophilum 1.58]|uniref:uncharacterized protein n=1 Tax=Cenococcum geophilum 1.58 TaxID=794803 RepID=UPI00358FB2B1|nr:hypothetical protein K441DRAFT_695107 [Cenococcum geophilum 1.58]
MGDVLRGRHAQPQSERKSNLRLMDDVSGRIAEKVQALSDIELAALLCLVAGQHCIVETEKDLIDGVEQELQLVCSNVFGLSCAMVDCSETTSSEDFGNGLLVREDSGSYFANQPEKFKDDYLSSYSGSPRLSDKRPSRSPGPFSPLDSRRIANVVIAKNLNETHQQVQIQALELIRGRRIFSRTAVHAAPKPFLFIALTSSESSARLTPHLNDQFFISHRHRVDDGLPNLEESHTQASISDDEASISSVIRTSALAMHTSKAPMPIFTREDIESLIALTTAVRITPEVRAYLHNIVVFMRLHRAVAGGISAIATRHFSTLVRALAPLHGLSHVSPSLVALAARKIYPHRIRLTMPENERSMQWGSSVEAVRAVLDGITVGDVIEEVLQTVEVPL